ncbi:MAG: hypothetical protein HY553_03625 [Elusimicrobia bacterium]|nr:hypothetical protein [Elusimicrobiota bacterium]
MWHAGRPHPLIVGAVKVGVGLSVALSAGDAIVTPQPASDSVGYEKVTVIMPVTISTSTDGSSLPIDYALAIGDSLYRASASTGFVL